MCAPNAQHALRQTRRLALNIRAFLRGQQLKPYRHAYAGSVASLGLHRGVASVYGLKLTGWPAWFLHRTYHLPRVPTLNRKVRVVADWTLALLFRGRSYRWVPCNDQEKSSSWHWHRPVRCCRPLAIIGTVEYRPYTQKGASHIQTCKSLQYLHEVSSPRPRSPREEAGPLKGSPVSVRLRPGALAACCLPDTGRRRRFLDICPGGRPPGAPGAGLRPAWRAGVGRAAALVGGMVLAGYRPAAPIPRYLPGGTTPQSAPVRGCAPRGGPGWAARLRWWAAWCLPDTGRRRRFLDICPGGRPPGAPRCGAAPRVPGAYLAADVGAGTGDRDADDHSLVAFHRSAVLGPVRVLPSDGAIVLDQKVHRAG